MYPCEEKYFSPAILNKNDLKVVVSIRAVCRNLNKTLDSTTEIGVPPRPTTWAYDWNNYRIYSFTKNESGTWMMEIAYIKSSGFVELILSLIFGIILALIALAIFAKIEDLLVSREWVSYVKDRIRRKKE